MQNEVRGEVIQHLLSLLKSGGTTENARSTPHTVVITKVLSLLPAIASSSTELQNVLDEVISVANHNSSHKVVSHAVQAAHNLVCNSSITDGKHHDQVIQLALTRLNTTNFMVKVIML